LAVLILQRLKGGQLVWLATYSLRLLSSRPSRVRSAPAPCIPGDGVTSN